MMPRESLSLRSRVVLALGLMIGFYVLALAIIGALLYVPYAEYVYAHTITWRLAAFCVVGAVVIAKAIVPRSARFVPPGPRLLPDEQPKLFGVVRELAAATGQRVPDDVYLVPEVNAYVMEHGGILGFGSRRVMGVGLPLLASISAPQFRAVIAHEFGHYHGGDTRLGPWIYRTRAAIGHTLQSLSRHSGILAKPFEWYGLAFLRITHAVSRRQEFVADAVAARVAGAPALAGGLRALEGAGVAFGSFWASEVAPVLQHGFRPPLATGFQLFVQSPTVRPQLQAHLGEALQTSRTDPYDTHPNLHDRLAALGQIGGDESGRAVTEVPDEPAALALLEDVSGLEARLFATLAPREAEGMKPISWTEVPGRVLPMAWGELTKDSRAALAGIRASELPEIARVTKTEQQALANRLGLPKGASEAMEGAASARAAAADAIVGAALSLRLLERGLRLEAPPGEPASFVLERDGMRLTMLPFTVLSSLRDGTMTPDAWLALAAMAELENVALADALSGPEPKRQPWH